MRENNFLKNASLLVVTFCFITQTAQSQSQVISLWSKVPDALKAKEYQEKPIIEDGKVQSTSQVIIPTLSVFFPKETKMNQTAIIVCPGGGYTNLAIDKEGTKVAEWLNSQGIIAFVLKYRLPSDLIMKNKTIGPLQDAQEAIRFVRSNAKKWNLNPEKIGIMGFSAGGHLAATVSTHYMDKTYKSKYSTSARPDFTVLLYPVISMQNAITHKGSQTNLLGANASQNLIDSYSNENKTTAETPPTFLIHATDDTVVLPENSINYYLALKKNNVTAELHLYEKGGHGFGLGVEGTSKHWTNDFLEWLKVHHYISKND